ncbi:MAG: type III pantothenate kinase [Candidatus Eisenbacteria bacterium]|nr:type III pantothenate kinase [Candidatus Eisenbacteria bacterium]
MLLAIDVGNTNVVIGVVDAGAIRRRWRITSDAARTADEHGMVLRQLCRQSGIDLSAISGAIVCSVVPALTASFVAMLEDVGGVEPVVVGPDLDLGIAIDYRDPREVGPDRLANAVGALSVVDGDAIVVDFGTATTFDVVSADRRYLGGAIAPGLLTSAETLFRKAALLHGVALDPPEVAIGRSTEESLRSGILIGAAGQVNEIVRRIAEEWGAEPTVVATGGLAERIAPLTEAIDIVEPDLTLRGLALIHERVKG